MVGVRVTQLCLFGVIVGTTSLASSAAWAQTQRAVRRLVYAAPPPGCPDAASFRDLVAARLGYDPFDDTGALDVTVEITMQRGKLQGRAEVAREAMPSGTRELSGELDRCEPLATALATTVAIALDAGHDAPQVEPATIVPPPLAPPPSSVLAVRENQDVPPPSRPPRPPGVSLVAFAGAVASAAVAPGPTFGPDLGAGFRIGSLSLEASARVETTLSDARVSATNHVDATIFSAGVVPCAHLGALAGCFFGRIGAFHARAVDVANPSLHTWIFAAAGLRGAYTLPLSTSVGLRGALEAGLPLVRTSLEIDDRSVWTAPPVFAGASVALLVKFL
ncbi:hypothetical protein BH11MYX4_BH11MYX4_22920 [soil metagenome]